MLSRTLLTAALLAAVTVRPMTAQAPAPAGGPRVAFPRSPVGEALTEWLEAFNAGDTVRLGAYYRRYGMQRSMSAQLNFARRTGGFELVSIERNEPRLLEWVARERGTGNLAFAVSQLSDGPAPTMTVSALYPIPAGRSPADFRIDAATRDQVISGAIAKLDSIYVFPEVAARMASAVRGRQQRGEYDRVTNGITFAALLTEHFREVSKDRHLGVNFAPAGVPDRRGDGPGPEDRERVRAEMERINCGFETAEKREGNIGYLKFNFFADPQVCGDKASQAMVSLAGVRALVIDLRDNGGGDPAMVAHISSYLFSKRTHLNDIWERRDNRTVEYWTNPSLPGAKIGDDVPVYVLTANRTFSGAEEFSYNLKHLKRATIVGETTGGGAHPVDGHKIAEKFTIGVPFARAINPITKTNWEGTGVEPDVKVPASQALATALQLIRDRSATP